MHPSEKQHMLPLSLTYEVFRTDSLTPSWCCSGSLCRKYLWTFWVAVHRLPRENDAHDNFLSVLLPLSQSKPSLPFFSLTCFLKRRLVGTVQVFHANSWSSSWQFSIPSLLNMWLICPTYFSSLCFYQSLHKTRVTHPSSCNISAQKSGAAIKISVSRRFFAYDTLIQPNHSHLPVHKSQLTFQNFL